MLKRAGFGGIEIKPVTARDSNILLTASVEAPQFAAVLSSLKSSRDKER